MFICFVVILSAQGSQRNHQTCHQLLDVSCLFLVTGGTGNRLFLVRCALHVCRQCHGGYGDDSQDNPCWWTVYFTAVIVTSVGCRGFQDVPLQSVNLHREVKQIMVQIMSEKRDWMTQAEIRALFHTMFSPELESLRVSLLNIAHEANNSQVGVWGIVWGNVVLGECCMGECCMGGALYWCSVVLGVLCQGVLYGWSVV